MDPVGNPFTVLKTIVVLVGEIVGEVGAGIKVMPVELEVLLLLVVVEDVDEIDEADGADAVVVVTEVEGEAVFVIVMGPGPNDGVLGNIDVILLGIPDVVDVPDCPELEVEAGGITTAQTMLIISNEGV